MSQPVRLFTLLLMVFLAWGCAGRKRPAPVESVHVPSKHPTHRSVAASKKTDKSKKSIRGKNYKVKKGETLYAIAWRAGIDFRTLAKINKISKPYRIFPEQIIHLTAQKGKVAKKSGKATSDKADKASKVKVGVKNTAVTAKTLPKKLNNNVAKKLAEQKQGEYRRDKQLQQPPKKVPRAQNNKPKKKQYSNKIRRWVWPTAGKVIAGFSNKENGNKGIDIGGKNGTNVVSAADGKVVYYGNALRGYGNLVIIKHNDDYLSAYAHNRRILVKEKDYVKAGQKIAEMGSTDSQNVKLHFEVRYRGKSVNPLKYLPKR